MYKKGLFLTIIISMVLNVGVLAEEQSVNINLNGTNVTFDNAKPIIVNNRTLIPLRGLFERLGYSVEWEAETKTAVLVKGSTRISIRDEYKAMQVNQNSVNLDVPAKIVNNSMMIPLRAVSEATGASVNWNDANKTVYIGTITREIYEDVEIDKYINDYMIIIDEFNKQTTYLHKEITLVNDENMYTNLRHIKDFNLDYIKLANDTIIKLNEIYVEDKYLEFHKKTIEGINQIVYLAETLNFMINGDYNYEDAEDMLIDISKFAVRLNSQLNEITHYL